MGLKSIRKVWVSGRTLVVSIPKNIREVKNIKQGDKIEVDFGQIVEKNKKEELPKIENGNNRNKTEVELY